VPGAAAAPLNIDRADAISHATLRDADEILDALDLHLRLHWTVREARRKEANSTINVDPGVIQERHHAFNWLVAFQGAPWDDVETPT
jgi:hypothetical protein